MLVGWKHPASFRIFIISSSLNHNSMRACQVACHVSTLRKPPLTNSLYTEKKPTTRQKKDIKRSNEASLYSLRQNYGSDFVIAGVQSLCVWICAKTCFTQRRRFVHLPNLKIHCNSSLDVGENMHPMDMIFPYFLCFLLPFWSKVPIGVDPIPDCPSSEISLDRPSGDDQFANMTCDLGELKWMEDGLHDISCVYMLRRFGKWRWEKVTTFLLGCNIKWSHRFGPAQCTANGGFPL